MRTCQSLRQLGFQSLSAEDITIAMFLATEQFVLFLATCLNSKFWAFNLKIHWENRPRSSMFSNDEGVQGIQDDPTSLVSDFHSQEAKKNPRLFTAMTWDFNLDFSKPRQAWGMDGDYPPEV